MAKVCGRPVSTVEMTKHGLCALAGYGTDEFYEHVGKHHPRSHEPGPRPGS